MRGSRRCLSGACVFLSGAFLVVWTAGALAQVQFEGGTWSFAWVIREKSCGTSTVFRGGRHTVTGCFPDILPLREKRTVNVGPGELPAVGPLLGPPWACILARGQQREQLVRYVASRPNPRRFVLHINDRAALNPLFASCFVPPGNPPLPRYQVNRWSSIVTVSADGQRVRQREILWDSWDTAHSGRAHHRSTASVRGKRTADVATTAAGGQDTGDTAD